MRLNFAILCFSAFMVFQPSMEAQAAPDPDAADKVYNTHDWQAAETLYAALTAQKPENARFWYRLGVSARSNKHFKVALEALQKAREAGAGKGLPAFIVDYEIATTYAAEGENAQALKLLKSSADAGYMQPDRLANDAEWNAFRKDDQFLAVAKQVQHNAAPCEDAEFRQFDFWIGDWDVASAADNVQRGSSHISKEMNGCVVWENWTSAGNPYFGKSYNTWNPNLKRWEQYWVDSSAGVMFFHGGLKDNVMDYWTDDVAQATGGKLLRHLQFFNLGPDKVRQFSQGSTDGGATWHTEYDFIYTRAASHGK